MSPGWADTIGGLLEIRWNLSRSPTLTQAGNTDQVCLHVSEAGRPLGKPTPSSCGPSLPHHRYPCLSPRALVILKDWPVLRTISRGLREGSTGSLSQTGNKGIIIIISIVKTTSLVGVMLLTFHTALQEYLSRSNSTISETGASPVASDHWLEFLWPPLCGGTFWV